MDMLALARCTRRHGRDHLRPRGLLSRCTASPRADLERRLGNMLGERSRLRGRRPLGIEALRSTRTRQLPIIGSFLDRRKPGRRAWPAGPGARRHEVSRVSEFVALRIFLALILAPAADAALRRLAWASCPDRRWRGLRRLHAAQAVTMNMAQGRRLKKLNEQLPKTLTMLSNSLQGRFRPHAEPGPGQPRAAAPDRDRDAPRPAGHQRWLQRRTRRCSTWPSAAAAPTSTSWSRPC